MERLTKRVDGIAVLESWAIDKDPVSIIQRLCNRLSAYEDTGLDPEEISDAVTAAKLMARSKIVSCFGVDADRIRELVQAEQDGRLVVLPCKVGATVYGHSKAEVSEYKVAVISLATYNWYLRCQNHNSDFWVTDADIGKTVFLSREEAEAAMALKGGDSHENRAD